MRLLIRGECTAPSFTPLRVPLALPAYLPACLPACLPVVYLVYDFNDLGTSSALHLYLRPRNLFQRVGDFSPAEHSLHCGGASAMLAIILGSNLSS